MLKALLMSALLIAGLAYFAYLVIPRLLILRNLKSENRFDQMGVRIVSMIQFAFGQWRMPREFVAGIAHIFIFFGFLVVSIATITHFVHAYIPGWHLPGLGGQIGLYYLFIKDVFEILVLMAVIYGLWRRLKPIESRVGRSWEGVFVLIMILILMLTDFITYGGELVVSGQSGLPWNPGGHIASLALVGLGPKIAHMIGEASWWIHCICILVFLNFLPIGKHFHVITAIPNVFFRNLKPWGYVEKVDLEEVESFGIRSSADLTWPMLLNTYSCTECGRCTMYCPTALTDKPLSHKQLNKDIKNAVYDNKKALFAAKGDAEKLESLEPLVGTHIKEETIWACTTCGSCEQECPVLIENIPRIVGMRTHKVLMEGEMAPELARAFKGMENNNNPWGLGFDQRDVWAEGLDIPRMKDVAKEGQEAPLLYWVGCAGSFDDRNKKITLAMVKLLKAAEIDFAILGQEEGCTGDSARRAGNEYLFQMMATQNVELLNGYNVKKILTHCPHCMHTLKEDYPQFDGNYEVIHHSEFIAQLINEGKLKPSQNLKKQVVWHDSCYLGRYHDIYSAPRNVLNHIPGVDVVEMKRNKSRSVCCGAGGARFWLEENIGERINVHRSKEALATGTDCIASACPFCLTMLKDGVAELGKDDDVKTLDIAEIVAQAL